MKLGKKGSSKEHKVRGQQYLTLMFITDATKEHKAIKIPKWLRFPLLIITVLLILGALSLYDYVASLEALVVEKNLLTQEALIESESKQSIISKLEEELNVTKSDRYEQLVQLQEQAVKLGLRLEELESYRNEMENLKEEIDTNLSSPEEENKPTSSNAPTSSNNEVAVMHVSALKDETFKLRVNPIGLGVAFSTTALSDYSIKENQGGVATGVIIDVEGVDFEEEIAKLNSYLDLAIKEVENGQDSFAVTTESLENIIPYVEAYPSVLPIQDTYITSYFGYRRNPFGKRSSEFHSGVDLKASYQPVAATGAGTVVESKYLSGYGYTIIIDHGYGMMTKYAHNSKLYAKVGDNVKRGDIISKSGNSGRSTGPHLHYEILIDGEPQNPLEYIYEEIKQNANK